MDSTKKLSRVWCTSSNGKDSENRLVNKDGSYRIDHIDPPNGFIKHFLNIFSFLLEIKWRWIILCSFVCFPLSWAIFALIYFAIAYHHGDFFSRVPPQNTAPILFNKTEIEISLSDNFSPCVTNVNSFSDMFLFSVESQQTIGYGYRYPSDQCPILVCLLCFQYVYGAVLQGCICGIVWARLCRPKRRGQEVLFSERAVIMFDDRLNRLCFVFRVTDIAGNQLIQSIVRLYMAKRQEDSFRLFPMNLGQKDGRDRLLLLWPTSVSHVIDEDSPLYEYGKNDMTANNDFEIIAVVEGIVETTGLTAQIRTSYLPNEISWGHRFQPMNFICKNRNDGVKIHYQEFDKLYAVKTPVESAKILDKKSRLTK